jgi:hypothetical protein
MVLTLEIIRSFKLPERTFKPDWDDTAIGFTLPNGIELTGFTQLNNERVETESLESEDGQIYIETKEELIALILDTNNGVSEAYNFSDGKYDGELDKDTNKKANDIIDALSDRGGFDGWWDYLDDDIKTEILNEIQTIIDK